jgi:glycerol uptake facilitator protein
MNPYLAEIIGTFVLISLGCGVNAGVTLKKSYANDSGWLVIAFGWGLAVTLAIYAVGSFSGAHINPAVTVGLAVVGEFPWAEVPGYIFAQLLGAFLGATIVWVHYMPHWKATEDKASKLGVFATGPAIPARFSNLISEVSGTFILLFGLMFIGANDFTQGLNPLVVGGLILAIGISLGGTTGYAINPARDLGPRLAHYFLPIHDKGDSGWPYATIPIFGPLLGGVWGTLTYKFLFQQEFMVPFIIVSVIVFVFMVMSYQEVKKLK